LRDVIRAVSGGELEVLVALASQPCRRGEKPERSRPRAMCARDRPTGRDGATIRGPKGVHTPAIKKNPSRFDSAGLDQQGK